MRAAPLPSGQGTGESGGAARFRLNVQRRRAVAAATGGVATLVAACVALVGLARPGTRSAAHGAAGQSAAPAPSATMSNFATSSTPAHVELDLAAWSVYTNADATLTVTVRQGL